ncbi:MAG: hypothetical protein M1835_001457 [Candelina submexicana]|nr:MAG: hypothetical protein M1835_001457 [Candelina submexicana]
MLTSSPSPTIQPSPTASFHYSNGPYRHTPSQSPRQLPRQPPSSAYCKRPSQSPTGAGASPLSSYARPIAIPRSPAPRRLMVDAGTQYSPPRPPTPRTGAPRIDSSPQLERTRGKRREASISPALPAEHPKEPVLEPQMPSKRPNLTSAVVNETSAPIVQYPPRQPASSPASARQSSPKRARSQRPAVKLMPLAYETCNVKDLVFLISNMLMELVRFNDDIPLKDGRLTRFHSRAPPAISIHDYLLRITTYATLSPPILLSMVYYIDRLCALYPAFNISSLTVHRFLITAATVASKGLSDSFWTNSTYSKMGGVSLRELALLELEFLWRVEWRIVPRAEVLVDYYKSLVERSEGYEVEKERSGDEEMDEDDVGMNTVEQGGIAGVAAEALGHQAAKPIPQGEASKVERQN